MSHRRIARRCHFCGKSGPRTPIPDGWAHERCIPLTPEDLKLEREIQTDVIEIYERLGCEVVVFTQYGRTGSGTHQTPGIADLKVYCARKDATWWHEVKTPSGKQSAEQIAFQGMVEACGESYVLGGTEPAIAQLRLVGLVPSPSPRVPPPDAGVRFS